MVDTRYTAAFQGKDGETTREWTLQSLYPQSIPAAKAIIVNSSAKDRTPQIPKTDQLFAGLLEA